MSPRSSVNGPTPRVAVYARFSSDMQQPVSIDRQVRTCREYAERQGWSEIPDKAVYADEAMSGSTAHRTQYQKLLAEIAGSNGRPPYDVILLEDLSRMSRDMSEVVRLVKAAPIWNIRVVGVNDGVDTARKGTKLLTYVKAAMNEEFLGDLKARVHGGLAERFRAGYHAGGSLYGYRTVPILDPSGALGPFNQPKVLGRKIEIDEPTATVIRRIFADAAMGVSPGQIAVALNHEHVPKPSHGYRFTSARGKARQTTPWGESSLRKILYDERYRGVWTWNRRTKVGTDEDGRDVVRRRDPDDGEILTQTREHLRLIDEATWKKAHAQLASRAKGLLRNEKTGKLQGRAPGSPGRADPANPWAGLLFCAHCGGPMVVTSTVLTGEKKTRHLGCFKRHWYRTECRWSGSLRLDRVDTALKTALGEYFSDAKLATQRMERFLEETNKETARQRAAGQIHEKAREEAEAVLARIRQVIETSGPGPTTGDMLKQWEAKKAAAEARIAETEALATCAPAMMPPVEVIRKLHQEGFYERRAAYRSLVARVEIRSIRRPGRRRVDHWEATITPVLTAGITGLPDCIRIEPNPLGGCCTV